MAQRQADEIIDVGAKLNYAQRRIFDVLTTMGLSWMGNKTFVRCGYLSPTRWDVMKEQEENGWNKSNEEWVKQGEQIMAEAIWAPTEDETKRWARIIGEEKWVQVPLARQYTTWIDPQA